MYFFLLHLSVADLLTAFLTLTPEIFIAGNESLESDLACKSVKFVQMIGPYLRWASVLFFTRLSRANVIRFCQWPESVFHPVFSAYTLVVMTIDRYQTIRFPIHYRIWKQANSNRKIILAWFVAVIFSLPRVKICTNNNNSVLFILHLSIVHSWCLINHVSHSFHQTIVFAVEGDDVDTETCSSNVIKGTFVIFSPFIKAACVTLKFDE